MTTTLSKPSERRLRRDSESGPLATMQKEFEDLLERFWHRLPGSEAFSAVAPRMDVAETDDSIEVTTDLPGIQPDEVEVELRDNCLVITAEHREEEEETTSKKFHRVERRRGAYSRSVWLPTAVNEDQVEAKLENGVLKVTLPKASDAPKRRIQVSG